VQMKPMSQTSRTPQETGKLNPLCSDDSRVQLISDNVTGGLVVNVSSSRTPFIHASAHAVRVSVVHYSGLQVQLLKC
jgi:hypothetical protein